METERFVSIVCLAYNHSAYIRDALDSFIAQKTDFQFEVLVHDDASTDETADIIREYEKKYPDCIKAIYQSENQYSKGIKIAASIYPKAVGKYIALCEGDDYWTDPYKLQKQVDFLEKHDRCSLCVHGATEIDAGSMREIGIVCPSNRDGYFTTEQIIAGDGCIFATNSMMFPRKYSLALPEYYYAAPVGDYPLMIYLSLCGSVYYMSEKMSVYRRWATGSWTENQKKSGKEAKMKTLSEIESMLLAVDRETAGRYANAIDKIITKKRIGLFFQLGCLSELREGRYRKWYSGLTLRYKGILLFLNYFPGTAARFLKIRRFLKNHWIIGR